MSSSASDGAGAIILDTAYFNSVVVDVVNFPLGRSFMNSALVTTGPSFYTIGSQKVFRLSAYDNGLAWDLTGGSAYLLFTAPSGATFNVTATISGRGAVVPGWSVPNIPGTWVRSWLAVDAAGLTQFSEPISFEVITSPGTPFLP